MPAALAAAVTRAGYAAAPLEAATPADPQAEERALWRAFALAAVLTAAGFRDRDGRASGPGLSPLAAWAVRHAKPVADAVRADHAGAGRARTRGSFAKGLPALLRGAPDMNALVAVGTLAAWGFSTLVLFAPALIPPASRSVWFEAAAVIVTLILLGRALEARARGRAGAAIARLVGAAAAKRARSGDAGREVPVASLSAGRCA